MYFGAFRNIMILKYQEQVITETSQYSKQMNESADTVT